MVLYECVSSYHLLCAIVYCKVNPDIKTDLLIYKGIIDKGYSPESLLQYFEHVIPYDIFYADTHSDKDIKRYFDSLLGKKGNIKNKYDEIYCSAGFHSFGYYLAMTHTPFVYCEDAAGMLSRPQVIKNINMPRPERKKTNPKYEEWGLYDGTNTAVLRRKCNINAQIEGYCGTNLENFDVVAELGKLDKSKRNEIIRYFLQKDISEISCPEQSTMILTQHYNNLGILSFEEQVLIYQYLVDYFFPKERIVFKPHPDDLMYYHDLFQDCYIVRERFPSEFMPFILQNQPKCIATISSASTHSLIGHYNEVFELDERYDKQFVLSHKYYVAVRIAEKLKRDIVCLGVNELLLGKLIEKNCKWKPRIKEYTQEIKNGEILIIDNILNQGEEGRKLATNLMTNMASCTIMINSKNDYFWYNEPNHEIWGKIGTVVIKKRRLDSSKVSEDFYESMEEEVLYVFSQNEEILKQMKDGCLEKELPHVGISITAEVPIGVEERIKTLEGVLAATEKRLMYYIQKEKEEQNQVDEEEKIRGDQP